jgi:rhodanese-related sulfurtransferase
VNEPVEPPEPPEPPEPVVRVEREQLVEDGVSWRISRLFVGDEFEEERRGAKRDSDGEFLSPTAEYRRISPTEAREIMLNQPHVLLDVRRQDEFDERHISGAILLPYDEIDTRADADLPDRHALILIYCRSGRRSEIAARALLALGYTNVLDFGGILDWDY